MGKGVRVRNTTVNGGLTGRDEQLGKVFAHKKGSSYSTMKKFTQAGNPNSSQQQAVRGAFASTSAGWSALTEEERGFWNDAAPDWSTTGIFGDKKQSGKNLYTGCNVVLALAQMPAITEPSNKAMLAAVLAVSFDLGLNFGAEFTTPSADNKLQLLVSKPQTAGTSKCDKLTILVNKPCVDFNVDLMPAYSAKYGAPSSGQKVFYEVRGISEGGNVSTIQKGSVILI